MILSIRGKDGVNIFTLPPADKVTCALMVGEVVEETGPLC